MMEQEVDKSIWEELETELKKIENIKIEFPKNSEKIRTKALDTFWSDFLNKKFPTGNLNTTLEKNFAVYIVKNNLDLEDIKNKYKSQGWSPQPLLGWIRKVLSGEIKDFNMGEIVNWCKLYDQNYLKEFKEKEKSKLPEEEINLIWDKDLESYEIEEKEWLVENLIPQGGVGVWTGKRGTFKTFCVMNAAYCISSGKKFLNSFKTKQGKVIYLDKENGVPIIKERSRMIKKGLDVGDSDIGFICFSQLKIDKNVDLWSIEELIEKHKPTLLVIDTYRRAISFDENDAGSVSKLFVDGLRPMVEKFYPLSIILIHHDRKGSGQGDEMDEIRGSSDLANYCDFILKNDRKGKNLVLKQLKNRNAPELNPVGVSVDTDEMSYITFTSTGEARVLNKDEKCAEILLVWIANEGLKQFKVADALVVSKGYGIGKTNCYNAFKLLENKGLIEKETHGFYSIVQNEKKGSER